MNEPLRIGVLGAARITPAAILAPARVTPGVTVNAIASRDVRRAEQLAGAHGIATVHPTYEALLGDPTVDAVYNPLPNGLHGRYTIAALEAGKHVLCEKPFTANADEAERVARVAADTELCVMEAMHYRHHPFARRVRAVVSDEIGEVLRVDATVMAVLPRRRDIRWELNLAGGALMDVGCYAVNQVRLVAGSEPTVVRAHARSLRPGVDRFAHAELELGGGRTGSVTCSLLSGRPPISRLRAVGSKGSLSGYFCTRPGSLGLLVVNGPDGRRRERVPGNGTTFAYQLQVFVDAVRDPSRRPALLNDAIANMRVVDACYEAAGIGRRMPTS
jgi:predicted dehydrogenase